MNKILRVLVISSVLLLGFNDIKHDTEMKANDSFDLIKLREINISDPIILKFTENRNTDSLTFQNLLVSKKDIENKKDLLEVGYQDYFFSKGYLFFTPRSFSCLLSNYLYEKKGEVDEYYNSLKKKIQDAEKDTIWVFEDKVNHKPKFYKGWEYHEIYPKNFTVFLVKGSALRKCQTLDEIVLKEFDNVYFKVIVPIDNVTE